MWPKRYRVTLVQADIYPGQSILTNGFRSGYRRNPAKPDEIRQDLVGIWSDFVGFRRYPDRNPLVRIPTKFRWDPVGIIWNQQDPMYPLRPGYI